MKGAGYKQTYAKAPEDKQQDTHKTTNNRVARKLIFDGVLMPPSSSVESGKKASPSSKGASSGIQSDTHIPIEINSDTNTEKGRRELRLEKRVQFDDNAKKDDGNSQSLTGQNQNPFSKIKPLSMLPIPGSIKVTTGNNDDNEGDQNNKHTPSFKLRSELFKPGLEEKVADLIFKGKIELTGEEAAALSPAIRKVILRKARNKKVTPRRRPKGMESMFTALGIETTDDSSVLNLPDTYINIEDIALEREEMFEKLTEDRDQMKAGSWVQRDVVDTFLRDLDENDDKREVPLVARNVLVAEASNSLRALCPVINNQEGEEVECVRDDGSQLIVIDRVIAGGLGISWDPRFSIAMQDAGGRLNKTAGLARNVPFRFGDITVYLQLHVQTNSPFQVLLGRPFEVLTEAEIRNFGNGDQEITIHDPNSEKVVTMGTFRRGIKGRKLSFDTSRYRTPGMKDPVSKGEPDQSKGESEEKENFQSSMI